MYEEPRGIPKPVENTDAEATTETREIDMNQYGYCFDPKASFRVIPGKPIDLDSDGD